MALLAALLLALVPVASEAAWDNLPTGEFSAAVFEARPLACAGNAVCLLRTVIRR